MKGYYTQTGYMGYVEGKYMLFASESEYYEYMKESDWNGKFNTFIQDRTEGSL